jgi:hypothetical protein
MTRAPHLAGATEAIAFARRAQEQYEQELAEGREVLVHRAAGHVGRFGAGPSALPEAPVCEPVSGTLASSMALDTVPSFTIHLCSQCTIVQ